MPSLDAILRRHQEDPAFHAGSSGVGFGSMTRGYGTGIVNTSPGLAVPCRVCQAEIGKGVQCFAWISKMEKPHWAKKLGPTRSPYHSTGVRWYIHHDCFIESLVSLIEVESVSVSFCGICAVPCEDRVYVKHGKALHRVCPSCAERFPIVCIHCTHRVQAHEASATLTPFEKHTSWDSDPEICHGSVCDTCARDYGLDTVHTRRIAHKSAQREMATTRAAVEEVQGWIRD